MSLAQPDEHFAEVQRALEQAWEETGDRWQDSVREEFASEYWTAFEQANAAYAAQLAELVEVLSQARQSLNQMGEF